MENLIFGKMPDWLANALYTLLQVLDSIVYFFINICYMLFETISKVEIFSNDSVKEITNRIYTIIGIFMLFVLAYNIILNIIDPDKLTSKDDKSLKGMVRNLVISLVLLIIFPLICEYLQVFQNHVVESNVISNLLLGSTAVENGSDRNAYHVATTIYVAFYHPMDNNGNSVTMKECEDDPGKAELCAKYVELAKGTNGNGINSNKDLRKFIMNDTLRKGINNDKMEYLWLISTIAGGLAAYLFLTFSIDLGVRAAKLGFLKLIAPVPIFLRITNSGSGGTYGKWQSEFIKTYLQVFERILIINIAMIIIAEVPNIDWTAGGSNWFINCMASVVIVLGILKFAKDAPKLIESLFSLTMPGLSIKKKLNDNPLAKRTVGALGAGVGNMASNFYQNAIKKDENDNRPGFGGFMKGVGKGIVGGVSGAYRGWQHGEDGNLGAAINTARAESNRDVENISQSIRHPIQTTRDAVTDRIDKVKEYLAGAPLGNREVELSAKSAQTMADALDPIISKFKEYESKQLADFYQGKKVVIGKNADGSDKYATSKEEITNYWKEEKAFALAKKFGDEQNTDYFRQKYAMLGERLEQQLKEQAKALGPKAMEEIFKNTTSINSIAELQKAFELIKTKGGLPKDSTDQSKKLMEDLMTISRNLDTQSKDIKGAAALEKQQKSEKKG